MIALETKRESAQMRSIALLTMIYLPLSCVAVGLFSMPFLFDCLLTRLCQVGILDNPLQLEPKRRRTYCVQAYLGFVRICGGPDGYYFGGVAFYYK